MAGVRVDSSASLILESELHLMCACHRDGVACKDSAVIGDHYRPAVAIALMDRHAVEVVAILHKDKAVRAFLYHGVSGHDDLISPVLYGYAQLHALTRSEPP